MIMDTNRVRNKISLLFIAVLFLTLQSFTQAQTGSIKGKVFDKETNQALIGCNIILEGTSMGAATNLDGNFTIRGVPAGKYTIVVSYIGYNSDSVSIDIYANRMLEQNFYLSAKALEGKTVTITAQAQGQVGAIQQQLTSNKIVNVVSQARIQSLPDFNAAQAISRLPGISTTESSGEANKVVIRGLAPQYNQITIGGISLASTGSAQIGVTSQGGTSGSINNNRSVDLSMISNYMIKNISVYKALTPDMNANAIGGVVNMELREAPSNLHADLLWQSGYTAKSNKYGNYRAVASISDRFFNKKLGVYLLGNLESYDRNADNMSAGYTTFGDSIQANGFRQVRVTTVTLKRHFETRKRYGANLILDYRLPSGSIEALNMFSRLSSQYQDFNTIFNYYYSPNELDLRYNTGTNTVDLAANSLSFKYDFGFMSVDLKAANNYSRNNLPYAPQTLFAQTGGVGQSTINTTPENLTAVRPNSLQPSDIYLSSLSLFSSDYKENDQTYKGDFKVPLNIDRTITGYFKFGGEFRNNYHHNQQNTPYADIGGTTGIKGTLTQALAQQFGLTRNSTGGFTGTGFTTSDGSIYQNSFLGDRFGKLLWANNPGLLTSMVNFLSNDPSVSYLNSSATNPGGWYDGSFQKYPNTYKYIEKYSAGYVMSELNYNNFMVVGGVRYENDKGYYDAWNVKDGRDPSADTLVYFVSSSPKNFFWLPMVQAKYTLTDWLDVRYAYTQTLARPAYSELSPHFTISYGNGTVRAGNPDLVPAQAYNHDLIFSIHSNDIGLITVDGFYKEIKNFSYATNYKLYATAPAGSGLKTRNDFNIGNSIPTSGATLYTYVNSRYIAYVKGIEFDLQTRFWYLPNPFNGLLLGLNYTKISSKALYPFTNARTTIIGPHHSVTEVFDSTRSGRLVDQPNDILNAYVGYDYEGFSARVSFTYTGDQITYVGNFPEQDGFLKKYFTIDASARQVLPWYGIELYFDINNLTNENYISTQPSIGGLTNQQNYGLTADLGLRYKL